MSQLAADVMIEKQKKIKIPEYLVYEVIDGKPIPYRGYAAVLNKEKTLEDIMGSSSLQSVIVSVILKFLYQSIPEEIYVIATNEAGIHLDKKNNLSTDIGIFNTDILNKLDEKYFNTPPEIAIEVDTKADVSQFANPIDYYHTKTSKLLRFGVKKVIWITTATRKVMIATAQADWITTDWNKEIEVTENIALNLAQLLEKRGVRQS